VHCDDVRYVLFAYVLCILKNIQHQQEADDDDGQVPMTMPSSMMFASGVDDVLIRLEQSQFSNDRACSVPSCDMRFNSALELQSHVNMQMEAYRNRNRRGVV